MERSVDLYSPLPPEAIARKLKAIMDDPMPDATARVFGKGSQHEMTLRYARRNRERPMAPVLDARMEPEGEGTRIVGTIGRSAVARLFPLFWFGFLSLFVIAGVLIVAFVPDTLLFGVIFAGIPIAMMIFGAVLFHGVGGGGMEDAEEILGFLRRELDAVPAGH